MKEMTKNILKTIAILTLLTVTSFSCDMGLGTSVDTEAPVITISTPKVASVNSQDINVTGTWSDDKKVTSIFVSVIDVDTKEVLIDSEAAVVNKNGTWSYMLYTKATETDAKKLLADGKYKLVVNGTDAAGHSSGDVSRSFEVDCTPPLFLVSKPNTFDLSRPASYGREIVVTGVLSDDNAVTQMDIAFYDAENGEEIALAKSTFTDFKATNTSITVAKYFNPTEAQTLEENSDDWFAYKNYLALYSDSSDESIWNKTKKYTAYISFTDKAGNKSSSVYLRQNLIKLSKEAAELSVDPEPFEFKNILNGSYSGSYTEEQVNIISSILKGDYESNTSYIADKESKLALSINSNINPTFSVSGCEYIEGKSASFKSMTLEQQLEIQVSSGLSGSKIIPSSLNMKIIRLNTDLTDAENAEVIVPQTLIINSKGSAVSEVTESVNSDTYTVKFQELNNAVSDDNLKLKIGKRYRIEIEGRDEDENSISPYADAYGFAVTDTSTPSVETKFYSLAGGDLKSVSGNIYVNGNSEVTLYGSYQNQNAGLSELIYTLDKKEYSVTETLYSTSEISTINDISDSIEWKSFSDFSENTTLIKSFKTRFTAQEAGDFVITGCNEVFSLEGGDGIAENLVFTITLDKEDPVLTGFTLSDSVEKEGLYYVNNLKGPFTLTGFADDNVGIENIVLNVSDGKSNAVYLNINENARNWAFENIDLSSFTDSCTFTLTLTDLAGNTFESSVNLVFDTKAPQALHFADYYNNDIVFRVGKGNNSPELLSLAKDEDGHNLINPLSWKASLDEDVGTMYSLGLYGNNGNIDLRGYFEDEGSGLASIYYKLYTQEPDQNAIDAFVADYENLASGFFHPLEKVQSRRVFYTAENSAGETYITYKEVESNFAATLTSSLSEGKNYLVLVAVDKLGNAASDSMKVNYKNTRSTNNWNGGKSNSIDADDGNLYYVINLDTVVPEVTASKYFNDTVYTNKTSPLNVYGFAGDAASGIKSLELTVNGNTISKEDSRYGKITFTDSGSVPFDGETVECSVNNIYWSAEIYPACFASMTLDSTVDIVATAYDLSGSGNSQTVNIASVAVDTEAPELIINPPLDADSSLEGIQVNGIISLTGEASDEFGFAEDAVLSLYYTSNKTVGGVKKITSFTEASSYAAGWVKAADCAGSTSWTLPSLDTRTLVSDNTDIYITAVLKDKAGNNGYASPLKLTVSQDTDRPSLSFTNISFAENPVWLKNTNTLYFVASDDDGIKTESDGKSYIYYSTDNKSSWNKVSLSNGSGALSLEDGVHEVYFKITDSCDTTFVTGENPSVKITDEKTVSDGSLLISVDKTSPVSRDLLYSYYESDSENPSYTEYSPSLSSLGGSRSKLAIKLLAGDENDIQSVKVKIEKSSSQTLSYNGKKITSSELSVLDSKYYSTWEIKDIDLSSSALDSGIYNLKLIVEDKAGLSKTDTVQLSVDNTSPTVELSSPSSTTTCSGSVIAYGSVSGASSMYYALSPSATVEPDGVTYVRSWEGPDGNSGACSALPSYQAFTSIGLSWSLYFDGDIDSTSGSHTDLMTDYLERFAITDNVSSFDTPLYLYLWTKAYDEVGNKTVNTYKILFDPQGDRPSIQITYPESTNATLGAKVKLSGIVSDTNGTSADKIGVKTVWMQAISTDHAGDTSTAYGSFTYDSESGILENFNITKNDLDYLASKGYSVYNMKTYNAETSSMWVKGVSNIEAGFTASDYGALVSLSGTAWNINLNASGEFDAVDSDTNTLAIRMIAKDGDSKYSVNNEDNNYVVYFDSDIPIVSDLKLIQKNGNEIVAGRSYSSDMYVKGDWYLTGSVSDNDTISSLKINEVEYINDISVVTLSADKTTATFEYPLVSSTELNEAGSWKFTVAATDAAKPVSHTGRSLISINYDNKAPVLASSSDADFNIEKEICQSNSWYTFGSKVTEQAVNSNAQSGFAYTAFYFKRSYTENGRNVSKLYDVLKEKSSAVTDISSVANIPFLGKETSNAENTIVTENNLYWFKKTITASSASQSLIMNNTDNVHVNSLISIAGTYYLVSSINANTITLSESLPAFDENDSAYTKAYVALAALVDNTTPESSGSQILADGYYESPAYDDGDRMIEKVDKSGTSWLWEANICSKNISDGPVELVYVVFDKAGNCTFDSVSATVCNYRPRLAGFTLETDYNGDSVMDESLTDYNAQNISLNSITSSKIIDGQTVNVYDPEAKSQVYSKVYPLSTNMVKGSVDEPVMKVRGYTSLMPEIVGGNGALYYSYSIVNGSKKLEGKNQNAIVASASTDFTINESNKIDIQTGDLIKIGNSSSGIPFEFKFWDSAEGTQRFTNETLCAGLTVYIAVNASSVERPVVKIKPFYWNSLNDNSIYDSKNASSWAQLKGHIELEEDWKNSKGYDNRASGSQYDADPKVSGAVNIEGSAHDDNLIKSLAVTIAGTSYNLASFDTNSASLKSLALESDYENKGYWFEITEETYTASGHDVEWVLHWNTEMQSNAIDLPVTVIASNYGIPLATTSGGSLLSIDGTTRYAPSLSYSASLSNVPGTVSTSSDEMTAYYRMDIVPYVTKVTTSLSSVSAALESAYNRTALGHYPVSMTFASGTSANATSTNYANASYETITVSGFNLAGGKMVFKAATNTNNSANLTATGSKDSDSGANRYSFTLPSGAQSGEAYVSVTREGQEYRSLNNINNDDSRGSYGYKDGSDTITSIASYGNFNLYNNFYNRIPNGENNNILTDNLIFDVWDVNNAAAIPVNNSALDIAMKINPASGMLNFAFCSGKLNWAMANGNNNSYETWVSAKDFIQSTGLAVDNTGRVFGTAAGGESSPNKSDTFNLFVSNWGVSNNYTSSGNNSLRVGFTSADSFEYIMKDRFANPSIVSDGTRTYLAYFDRYSGDLRFQGGGNGIPDNKAAIGTLTDAHAGETNLKTLANERALLQVIADSNGNSLGYSGEYLCLGIAENHVVIVWYDSKNNNLMYSYNTNANLAAGETGVNKNGWADAQILLENAGKFCQLAVANDGSIHVACYDSLNGDLKYIYMRNYQSAASRKVCTVDSYLNIGKELTIDVAQVGSYQIPYIGYYGTTPKKPHHAYLADPETFYSSSDSDVISGVVDDLYTGVWECTIVPTKSIITVNDEYPRRINVAVWKNGANLTPGVLAYSTTGANRGAANGTNSYSSSVANKGNGICYGNGSNNAVLAYGVKHSSSADYVETAQKRQFRE